MKLYDIHVQTLSNRVFITLRSG